MRRFLRGPLYLILLIIIILVVALSDVGGLHEVPYPKLLEEIREARLPTS